MLPAVVLPKPGKLVLMLSSDKPGEVAAAADAITRTLRSADATRHDLAARLTEPRIVEREAPPRYRWRAPTPEQAALPAGPAR